MRDASPSDRDGLDGLDGLDGSFAAALSRLAADACEVAVALVARMAGDGTVDVESATGLPAGLRFDRSDALTDRILAGNGEIVHVADLRSEPALHDHRLVAGAPRLRFLAGIALRPAAGPALGVLWIADGAPRDLAPIQRRRILELAALAGGVLSARQSALRRRQETRSVYLNTPAAIYALDRDGALLGVSQRWSALLGRTAGSVLGRPLDAFMTDSARSAYGSIRDALWGSNGCEDLPCQFVRGDGAVIDVQMSVRIEHDASGAPWRALCAIVDVTRQLRLQRQLERASRVDSLTGVWNRGWFLERLAAEAAHAGRHGRPLALVMFDLDHFKRINDTWGHAAGDLMLRHVVTLCRVQLRQHDEFGRLGGEEFAILLPETPVEIAFGVAERLRLSVEQSSVRAGETAVQATLSLGVTALRSGETMEQALARTDVALYDAKRAGRNRTVIAIDDAGPPPAARRNAGSAAYDPPLGTPA